MSDADDFIDRLLFEPDDAGVDDLLPHINNILEGDSPECVKNLYRRLQRSEYMTVGSYISKASDEDLRQLVEYADDIFRGEEHDLSQSEYDEAFGVIILMALGWSFGEGVHIPAEDDYRITKAVQLASMFITLESLYRRGEIDVYHKNMSMSIEGNIQDAVVARKRR